MIPAEQWTSAWSEHESTTIQQAALAEADLERWLKGEPHASFDAFRNLLQPVLKEWEYLLEIGCGAGYYKRVLYHINNRSTYMGIDVSDKMVAYASRKWGYGGIFTTANSEKLPFVDNFFQVSCISGLIQHLADYRKSIQEAYRVSKQYVLLHRVEATIGPTVEFVRRSYDSDVPTRRVNHGDLYRFCEELGMKRVSDERWSLDVSNWNTSILWKKA
jgi:SAM-dependent methyltransferase